MTFDLARFEAAQAPVIGQVLEELRAGRKRSHWMWFVFPQMAGLGSSAMARHYAIGSLDEARAYLRHEALGPRLLECTRLATKSAAVSAHALFSSPDDLKFRSSMTLFGAADPNVPEFPAALRRFFGGEPDGATLRLIG